MKPITEAYIGYHTNSDVQGMKIKTFKNLNAANAYDIDYVRYIANAYNFILGRFAYFSRRANKPVSEIIVTDADLSRNIGCHVKHSSVVLNQLKALFDLSFERKSHFGARYITNNEKMVKFLTMFTESELEDYIETQKLKSKDLIYAIYHLFRYRVWTVSDSKLSPSQKQKKQAHQERYRDYYHQVYSSNRSDFVRIELIEEHQELLNEKELGQLANIKEARKQGKLSFYWNKILIRLEQKITAIIHIKANEPSDQLETMPRERKYNDKVKDVAKASATSRAQRLPEDTIEEVLSLQDVLEVCVTWNNMIEDQAIPFIKEIDHTLITSLNQMAKKHGKEELKETIKKVKSLYHDSKYRYKMTIERFLRNDTFNMLKNSTSSKVDVDVDWVKEYLVKQGESEHTYHSLDQLPAIKSLEELNEFLNTTIS